MRKNVCAAVARREIRQGLLLGPVMLAAGLLILFLQGIFSGPILVVLENLGKNFIFLCVSLFLVLGGAYLLFHGLRGLLRPDTTDICRSIRTQLRPEEEGLTGKEVLALADRDLACARAFAGGGVLVGREWLCVPKAMGQPVVRLENLHRIDRQGTDSTGLHLRFVDHHGCGPVTGELTAAEAAAIQMCLQNSAPNLRC